eukprot:1212872-Pyramimonas_sp.AAC.1
MFTGLRMRVDRWRGEDQPPGLARARESGGERRVHRARHQSHKGRENKPAHTHEHVSYSFLARHNNTISSMKHTDQVASCRKRHRTRCFILVVNSLIMSLTTHY